MTKHIDPIAVREHRDILDRRAAAAAIGVKAANALLWFADHVKDQPSNDIIKISASPVASATSNADIAARYIQAAALSCATAILDKAMSFARADLARANSEGEQ